MKLRHILLAGLIHTYTPLSAGAVSTACDSGFKRHLADITIYIDRVPGSDLASALQDAMKTYDVCSAGDEFSSVGKWKDILDRLQRIAAQ